MVFPQVETIPPRYDKAKFNNQIVPVINDYLLRKFTKSESFIVEPNEERFEAQSGESGKVSYGGSSDAGSVDGSDANAVLQAALNAGISINVKLGTYPITHLDVNSAKLFSTENAILAPTTNETDPAIKLEGTRPELLGFTIDGTNADPTNLKGLVYVDTAYRPKIRYNDITVGQAINGIRTSIHSSFADISFNWLGGSVNAEFGQGLNVAGDYTLAFRNYLAGFPKYAVVVGDGYHTKIIKNTINQLDALGTGIEIAYSNQFTKVIGNDILSCAHLRAIELAAQPGSARGWSQIYGTIIKDNLINALVGSGGIIISTETGQTIYNTEIVHNHFECQDVYVCYVDHKIGEIQYFNFANNWGKGILDIPTYLRPYIGNRTFSGNRGFVGNYLLESHSVADVLIANAAEVTHGLCDVPSSIIVQSREPNINAYPTSKDATKFVVQLKNDDGSTTTGDHYIYWEAKCEP